MEPDTNNFHKKRRSVKEKRRIVAGCILLTIVLLMAIVYFLVRGKTTTTGQYPNPNQSSSLVCDKKGEKYPKITRTNSGNKSISIAAIFDGEKSLRSILLKYTLVYQSEEEAINGEALAHFEFGSHLVNMDFNEFDNKFSIVGNKLVISLAGAKTDIEDETRASYFMLGTAVKDGKDLNSLTVMKEVFEKKGFSCKTSGSKT